MVFERGDGVSKRTSLAPAANLGEITTSDGRSLRVKGRGEKGDSGWMVLLVSLVPLGSLVSFPSPPEEELSFERDRLPATVSDTSAGSRAHIPPPAGKRAREKGRSNQPG